MAHAAKQSFNSFLQVNTAPVQPETNYHYPSFLAQTSRLEYKDKVSLTFQVPQQFAAHFILIKGLIDFHRPAAIQFTFDREHKTIEVKTAIQYLDLLESFFTRLNEWLTSELQFKKALKSIIQFEEQYKSQRSALYGSLLGI